MTGPANSMDADAATAASARETCDDNGRGAAAGETQGADDSVVVNFDACVVAAVAVGLTATTFAITPLLLLAGAAPVRDADACSAEVARMLGTARMKPRGNERVREKERGAG